MVGRELVGALDGGFNLHINRAANFTFILNGLVPQNGNYITDFSFNEPNDLTYNFNATTGALSISFAGNITTSSDFVGTFTTAAVPEPAVYALAFAAVAGIFVAWRRRARA